MEAAKEMSMAKNAGTDAGADGWVLHVYEAYSARVYRFMMYRTGHVQASEDLTGAVFMRIIEKRHSFDEGRGSLDVWVFTVARHILADYMRSSRRKHVSLDELEGSAASGVTLETHVEQRLQVQMLLEAVGRLKPREAGIISLKYAGGLKNAEIAKVMKLSEKNVGVILSRCRKRLKELLLEEEENI